MSLQQKTLTSEEAARLGDELYERKVLPSVTDEQHGLVAAIDLSSGEFALAETALEASEQLRARFPGTDVWFVRVGQHALHRIGAAEC